MARQSNTGQTGRSSGNEGQRNRSGGRNTAHRGTSRGARHLNDDIDAGNARDEDSDNQHDYNFHEHGSQHEEFGEVQQGDTSDFRRGLSFQGKGFFGEGPPYEHGNAHIGMGNAVGYGPGRQSNGAGFRGKGPKDYKRSDERLTEDINERLTYDDDIDAGDISVAVADGEVTLSGTVHTRAEKRRAEDLADEVPGITHVQNNLRVKPTPT